MIQTIHVVFKTHLDLGFTDTARTVTRQYIDRYLPAAMRLASELERRGGAARFIWTTGSWMIQEALRLGDDAFVTDLTAAIERGDIAWHALPLTTHTEIMDAGLVEHALRIGRKLDERFSRHTIAGKMTDVPGHTIGLVPLLERGDVRFLHLGVNGASAVPDVPEFFVWRAPTGEEVVDCYARSYGATELGLAVAPGGTAALHLAHTGDNDGPPSADDVEALFAGLRHENPGSRVIASTLDAFAAEVLAHRSDLPVVTSEIGDSWIHGVASDPTQTANLRALLRLRASWIADGALVPGTPECDAFGDGLLLVAEHTWGEDLKTYLPDYVNYTKADFTRARAADLVDTGANPPETDDFAWTYTERAEPDGPRYSRFERSWAEQRGHVDRALAALSPARRAEAEAAMAETRPAAVAGEILSRLVDIQLGPWLVTLGSDGSITRLLDADGVDHAGAGLARYVFQTFDERDEERWIAQYCRDLDETGMWAIPDQSKPGLRIADTLPGAVFVPAVREARLQGDALSVELALPASASEHWGAARCTVLTYRAVAGGLDVTLDLSGRDASRLPEASWLGFFPDGDGWRLRKLGSTIDPTDVVRAGNRRLHAVEAVTSPDFTFTTLDAPLVSVGERSLYRFPQSPADPSGGFHVNLHNNTWGTNFPMWFDDDRRYRFELRWSGA